MQNPDDLAEKTGGTEGLLDGAGIALLILGGLAAAIGLVAAGQPTSRYAGWGEEGFNPIWVGIAMSSALWGFLGFAALRFGAEVVRLLKHIAGFPYGGAVSSVREGIPTGSSWLGDNPVRCTNCHQHNNAERKHCIRCGATLPSTVASD